MCLTKILENYPNKTNGYGYKVIFNSPQIKTVDYHFVGRWQQWYTNNLFPDIVVGYSNYSGTYRGGFHIITNKKDLKKYKKMNFGCNRCALVKYKNARIIGEQETCGELIRCVVADKIRYIKEIKI